MVTADGLTMWQWHLDHPKQLDMSDNSVPVLNACCVNILLFVCDEQCLYDWY